MGDDIRNAAGRLIGGQRLGQGGIQDGKPGPVGFAAGPPLDHAFLFGDNRIRATFAARGGDGQHRSDGQRLLHGLSFIEIPEIPVVNGSGGDGLGGVNRAAAADGQHEVDPFLPAKFDSLVNQPAPGIRPRAAQLHMGDARGLQGSLHPVKKPRANHGAAAIVQQRLVSAEALHQGAGLVFGFPAEGKIGRGVKSEIVHVDPPLSSCGAKDRNHPLSVSYFAWLLALFNRN